MSDEKIDALSKQIWGVADQLAPLYGARRSLEQLVRQTNVACFFLCVPQIILGVYFWFSGATGAVWLVIFATFFAGVWSSTAWVGRSAQDWVDTAIGPLEDRRSKLVARYRAAGGTDNWA